MLGSLIPSQTRVKLLTLFLLNPGREYYQREVARMTGENINAVRRELSNLETFGLLLMIRRGNQLYYTVNRTFFLFEELQKIILKTEGVAALLREHLDRLGTIECMFIYGSSATGKAGATSDIDLFIVGDVDEGQLIPLIQETEKQLNREINYVVMRNEELRVRREGGDPFVTQVLQEPRIILKGACDD